MDFKKTEGGDRMSYHYEVGTKFGYHAFETMSQALQYRARFGGIVYLVLGNGDRARIA